MKQIKLRDKAPHLLLKQAKEKFGDSAYVLGCEEIRVATSTEDGIYELLCISKKL